MRDLPRSVYSTPGMVGLGNAKIIEESDQDFGGMQIVYAARTAAISKVRAPCFGFTNGTYQEKPYRAAVYCLERKELKIVLSLAFFGENLTWRAGAPAPACEDERLEYDIVTRAHVDRALPATPAWTEARALAHFGMA